MNVVKISAKAPTPLMNPKVAPFFEELRKAVREKSGVDFLAKAGDVFRDAGFTSSKDGVANRSNHKTGRAFDYDQESKAIIILKEPRNGRMYFRTFLKCAVQDGSLGHKMNLHDKRGFSFNGYVIDFTALAAEFGFERIPAWSGWENHYNRQEFWHYQKMDGLTWDEAMAEIKRPATHSTPVPKPPSEKIYGRNDRGPEVRMIQEQLVLKGLLPKSEVDGVFGAKTYAAVVAFQKAQKLPADGLVGPQTRQRLM